MIDISVVIPTYNEELYIRPCLNSLLVQVHKPGEIIVADSSDDTTPAICNAGGARIIKLKKGNISRARQKGFLAAKSPVIASTDADTVVGSNWLDRIADNFQDEEVVCVYGPVYFYDGPFLFKFIAALYYLTFLFINRVFKCDHIAGMNFAVRKKAFTRIGGFDFSRKTAEDIDLGYRIRQIGKIVYDPSLVVYTSARRFLKMGILKVHFFHIRNFLNMRLNGKSADSYLPVR